VNRSQPAWSAALAYGGNGATATLLLPRRPLNLGHPADQVRDVVAVEFGDRRDPVNVPQEVLHRAEEDPECRLAVAPPEQDADGG
jgi:hypothetical protein